MDRMYRGESDFEIIPIVGMGGIGKSTLVRKLFEEASRGSYFDRCAWIVVSQKYSRREILLAFLQSLTRETDKRIKMGETELAVAIHKEQYNRRCLVVIDDLWSTEAWDSLNTILSKEPTGSRVLMTTRELEVANYVASSSNQPHQMQLLEENSSWILLKQTVFGKGSCPSQLEDVGKKIAQKCRGLPLTIVVTGGLLKVDRREEYWENISQNISSREPSIATHCSKVLSLSYDRLPVQLKPCFLYVTAFPEDSDINANQLMRLWIAEGFVEQNGSQELEEVAKQYLNDLVGRSLLRVSKKTDYGRVKAVGIHDLLRDFGTVKSQKERCHFRDPPGTSNRKPRRLSIQTDESLRLIQDVDCRTMRSLLIFLSKKRESMLDLMWCQNQKSSESHFQEGSNMPTSVLDFPLIRIFDAPAPTLIVNPEKSIHLRYFAFDYDKYDLPKSWLKLQKLETLIISGNYGVHDPPIVVPLEIWKMPSLRNLILPEMSYLEQPNFDHENVEETNLQTVYVALGLRMSTQTAKMLKNVRKLGLRYHGPNRKVLVKTLFENVVHLEKLEAFKLIFGLDLGWPTATLKVSAKFAFPPSLKRLTLINTYCCWEDMKIVGSLPNLEVLKLRNQVARDREWYPEDDQFEKLKFLELVAVPLEWWGAESHHFPSLEILVIKYVFCLEEIPSSIGEIDTLKLIRVYAGKQSLIDSAKQIQADQLRDFDNNIQVDAS